MGVWERERGSVHPCSGMEGTRPVLVVLKEGVGCLRETTACRGQVKGTELPALLKSTTHLSLVPASACGLDHEDVSDATGMGSRRPASVFWAPPGHAGFFCSAA